MKTKTVNVRLLVNDDVDVDLLVAQLVTQTAGPGAPLGAVRLLDDGYGVGREPSVHARGGIEWGGLDR